MCIRSDKTRGSHRLLDDRKLFARTCMKTHFGNAAPLRFRQSRLRSYFRRPWNKRRATPTSALATSRPHARTPRRREASANALIFRQRAIAVQLDALYHAMSWPRAAGAFVPRKNKGEPETKPGSQTAKSVSARRAGQYCAACKAEVRQSPAAGVVRQRSGAGAGRDRGGSSSTLRRRQ